MSFSSCKHLQPEKSIAVAYKTFKGLIKLLLHVVKRENLIACDKEIFSSDKQLIASNKELIASDKLNSSDKKSLMLAISILLLIASDKDFFIAAITIARNRDFLIASDNYRIDKDFLIAAISKSLLLR